MVNVKPMNWLCKSKGSSITGHYNIKKNNKENYAMIRSHLLLQYKRYEIEIGR